MPVSSSGRPKPEAWAEAPDYKEEVRTLTVSVLGDPPRGRRGSLARRKSQQQLDPRACLTQKEPDGSTAPGLASLMLSEVLDQLSDRTSLGDVMQIIHQWEEKCNQEAEGQQDSDGEDAVEAPEGKVAFVFTDIASSTALWEQVPEAMDEALSTHNRVMRRALRACAGYEVKTIGDAFMVAFKHATEAVKFCLQVQTNLVEEEWPEELQEVPAAAYMETSSEQVVYNGLRVRMGCNVGEVIKETNPLTGRADYRGHTVNTAARVEGQGVGGQVFITSDVREQIEADLRELGDPVVRPVGLRTLKGVAKAVELYAVVPNHLVARLSKKEEGKDEARPGDVDKGASPFHTQLFSGLGKQLGMKMKRASGSLVVARPYHNEDLSLSNPVEVLDAQCNLIRFSVMDIAKTEGQLESVVGDALIAAWNTTRACMAHTEQALRFAALAYHRRNPLVEDSGFGAAFGCGSAAKSDEQKAKKDDQLIFGIGVGKLAQGTVGTARQRFRVILGHVERLAHGLADHCAAFGTWCLLSRRPQKTTASLEDMGIEAHVRPVDIWQVGSERCAVIEEANLVTLSRAEQEFGVWDFLAEGHAAGMGGGELLGETKQKVKGKRKFFKEHAVEYFESFHAAIRGDAQALERIERISEEAEKGDYALKLVCQRIRAHQESGMASPDRPARYELVSLMPARADAGPP
eukprot:TRINITY_DN145_c1_g1_i1.p1 TRINITY_DN145_c1_g1~~TRINITY_DN145_c1_g1_i1.p1  ORF type:complete len:689 (+),score=209.26 TRINITY_DN145_c1_g1_i1:111-2177(+)